MMETSLRRGLAVVLAIGLVGTSSAAMAGRNRSFGGGGFASNGTFGLGLELGEPSGLNGKYFVAPDRAIDFGIGAIYGYYYGGNGVHIYGDYLWHPATLLRAEPFQMPFYVGVGARIWNFDCNGCANNATAFGVRVPFGIALDFNDVPLDVFFQLVVVADFYNNYRDRIGVGVDGSVGIRFWFD